VQSANRQMDRQTDRQTEIYCNQHTFEKLRFSKVTKREEMDH